MTLRSRSGYAYASCMSIECLILSAFLLLTFLIDGRSVFGGVSLYLCAQMSLLFLLTDIRLKNRNQSGFRAHTTRSRRYFFFKLFDQALGADSPRPGVRG